MSKKILCLFLCFVMLLSVCLTACSKKDADEALDQMQQDASQSAITLVMYLMSEAPVHKCEYDESLVDAEGKNDSKMCRECVKATKKAVKEENIVDTCTYRAISKAVNSITERKYKTRIELRFYTEDEYYTALDAAFAERADAKNNKVSSTKPTTEAETAEEQVYTDENGIVRILYPTPASYQVDIFYMGGKVNFDKYKNSGMLQRLDDEINNSSKDLATSIPSQYLSNIKSLNSGTYAVPTSKTIGEYTYLILNKNALKDVERLNDEETTTFEAYTSLTCDEVQGFVDDVVSMYSDKYYPIKTNLDSTELLISNLKYWGIDSEGELSDAFSVIGGYYGATDDYLDVNKYAKLENLLENEQFINDIKVLKNYEISGYYSDENDKDFAVGYMTGGADLVEKYGDDYVMIPVEYPRLTEEELYSDLFAVSSYTASVGRSMQIITLLNTDIEFRNILLYGIDGTHYELITATYPNPDPDDPVKEIAYVDQYGEPIKYVKKIEATAEHSYSMSINKTGNTMIAYPECYGEKDIQNILYPKQVGETVTKTGYGIEQNRTAKVVLDLGFALETKDNKADKASLAEVRDLSARILEEIKACKTMEELELCLEKARADVAASKAVQYNLACNNEETHDSTCHSLYCCYRAWLKSKGIIK